MLTTIKGVYNHGKITLTEEPPVKTKADVIVTFLTDEKGEVKQSKRKLGGLEGKVTLPVDFNEPIEDLKDYM
jgi:ABC-type Na+ efflux pump permease subunit